jgi:plastocyanin
MKKQTKVWLVAALALSLGAIGSSCSKAPEPDTNKNGGSEAKAKYSGATGTVTGVVSFNGTPPAPKKIDSSADPVCGQKNPNLETEDTVVKDGKLANAFVYIKDGTTTDGKKVGDFEWDTPTAAAQLDQNGCHYRPHVLGVQTNQKISITNSDPTTHNIHPTPKQNPEWNQSQPNGAAPIEKTFARAEILVPVKCNQHPWMKAYIGVMRTPFFAVSADNGSFTLKGVPAGTYTVAAWHEGGPDGTTKTVQVTVPANGTATADFAFEGGAAAASNQQGGLQMLPAIEFPMLGRKH